MEKAFDKLVVTESPHGRHSNTTQGIMMDVVIALVPTLLAGTLVFGYRAAVLAFVCVAAAVCFEWGWNKLLKKPSTINDFSAVVTGLLLALNLPATMPIWMAVVGVFFAIIIVKQFFGGIGHNFMNPALAARAFLLTSWAQPMTTWPEHFPYRGADAVAHATPLAILKSGEMSEMPELMDMFLGNVCGSIGEVSALAILIGGAYLLVKKVISIRVPLTYILTVAVLTFVFGGKDGLFTGEPVYHILSGGLLLGAFFMATDYVTTPYTQKGRTVFGIGCGVITVVIRLWGGYPEGVTYAILLMNAATPLIDKFTAPRRFGEVKFRRGETKNA